MDPLLDSDAELKLLLQEWRSGSAEAKAAIFEQLYRELSDISAALLNKEGGISLASGDLVNEAALKLINLNKIDWQDKAHFLAFAARVMRQVLVDHSRKKMANKRFHQKVTLMTDCADNADDAFDLEYLEDALQALKNIDPDRVKVVEMRYFGGLTIAQIAAVMGVSESTAKRSWRSSRAWLLNALEEKVTSLQ